MSKEVNKLRGHNIILVDGEWLYEDTRTPTVGNERACGACGKSNTVEGHDGCVGTLPNVMNACCGHGIEEDAYVQHLDGSCTTGAEALKIIWDNAPINGGGVIVPTQNGEWVRVNKDTFRGFETDFRKFLRKRRLTKKGKR